MTCLSTLLLLSSPSPHKVRPNDLIDLTDLCQSVIISALNNPRTTMGSNRFITEGIIFNVSNPSLAQFYLMASVTNLMTLYICGQPHL